jgi:hypothetical protein
MWVGGDFATYTDGVQAAPQAADMIFPLITPKSTISIANPGTASINAFFRVFGPDGMELGPPFVQPIAPKGFFSGLPSALFPSADITQATHIRVTSTTPFSGTVVTRDYLAAPSSSAVNAVDALSSAIELDFPHAIDGPLGSNLYTSVLGITNLNASRLRRTRRFLRS